MTAPVKYRTVAEREKAAGERFVKDVADHELTITLDDGMYRHLKCRQPGSSTYWFEVVTWPGCLVIRGDMDTYAFARASDMFGFFRSTPGHINTTYWAEKVTANGLAVMEYSEEAFRDRVTERLAEWVDNLRGFGPDGGTSRIHDLTQAVTERVLDYGGDAESAVRALNEFWHDEHQFTDVWEMDFREYTTQFLWCLHAIVHAIALYDAATAPTSASGPPADLVESALDQEGETDGGND